MYNDYYSMTNLYRVVITKIKQIYYLWLHGDEPSWAPWAWMKIRFYNTCIFTVFDFCKKIKYIRCSFIFD